MPRARTSDVVVQLRPPEPPLPGTAVADGYHPALPVEQIQANPRNIRRELGDLDELIASVAAVGVRHPVTVTPVPSSTDAHQYLLIDGHRRYAAAVAAGLAEVPAIVRTDLASERDVLLEMIRAGLLQERLTPIEEATAYQQLELLGMNAAAIAKATGRSRSTVDQRLHLMDLPETVRDRVHAREVTLDEAAGLAEFTALLDSGWKQAKKWVADLEKAVGTRDWSYRLTSARQAWDRELLRRTGRALAEELGYRLVKEQDVPGGYWNAKLDRTTAPVEPIDGEDYQATAVRRARAHVGCPGAAAFDAPYDGVQFLCLQRELHEQDPDAESRPGNSVPFIEGQLGEEVSLAYNAATGRRVLRADLIRQLKAEQNEDGGAAAAVRRTWIRNVLLPGRKPLTAAQTAAVARYVAIDAARFTVDLDGEAWCNWLGLDAPDPDVDEVAYLADALAEHRDPHRALLAGLATGPDGPRALVASNELWTWIRLLQGLGYQPCSWELDRLTPPSACRRCSCTQEAACVDDVTGDPCSWATPGLCTAIACLEAELTERHDVDDPAAVDA